MGSITIFKEITTNEVLLDLEKESKKWDGLTVDMEDKEQRKFVKGKASVIADLIKKVDRKRIDESKDYKNKVDAQALDITERLMIANIPFTGLIDTYKAERAKILAEEKAIREAKELAIQIEVDHEDAIQYNKVFNFERDEQEELKAKRDEQLKKDAIAEATAKAEQDAIKAEEKRVRDVEQAKQDEINKQNAEQQRIKDDEAKRLANQEHVTTTCKSAKETLMQFAGLTEEQAINAVKAIRNNQVLNVTLNF